MLTWRIFIYHLSFCCWFMYRTTVRLWGKQSLHHRVLNGYRGPSFLAVIWSGPLTPSLPSASCLFLILPLCRPSSLLTGEAKMERWWARSQIIQSWESLVLYISFNTLWSVPSFVTQVQLNSHTAPHSFQLPSDDARLGQIMILWDSFSHDSFRIYL